jgi:hypothetical protein
MCSSAWLLLGPKIERACSTDMILAKAGASNGLQE